MAEDIIFKPKIDKIVETLLFLSHKGLDLNAYRAVKLIYLADLAHLQRFARPITFDRFTAMENGPVASATYDILKAGANGKKRKIKCAKVIFDPAILPFDCGSMAPDNEIYINNPKRVVDGKVFSRSDLRVLEEIVDEYGTKSRDELYDITHAHLSYKNAWNKRGDRNHHWMAVEDMIGDKPELVEELRITAPYA